MRSQFSEEVDVMGVDILDIPMAEAITRLGGLLRNPDGESRSVFFVNASTVNLASEDESYRRTLNSADYVFGDGTGVRWAAKYIHGVRLQDNVNGTDLVPRLFEATAGLGYKYFLLGATPEAIERAAGTAKLLFPGWTLAGYHHGYLNDQLESAAIESINRSGAHMLLVGMGNPRQEQFIARNLVRLSAPLCLGVGGLFTYWSGDLRRASAWVRRLGFEWLHLLLAQPHKFRRYVLGNPLFLWRMMRYRWESAESAASGK